jgi:hypothetical protein
MRNKYFNDKNEQRVAVTFAVSNYLTQTLKHKTMLV